MTDTHLEGRGPGHGGVGVLVVICSALFFGVVNGSAVAVVLPEIGSDLNIASGDLAWVLSLFLLVYGVAIPFYGRLAARYGQRTLFLGGIAMFSIGSVACALSTGLATLLVARSIQAVGDAALPGLGLALASEAFPIERRGFVLGIISATLGVGSAAGPLAAGLVSELASWRWLFGISALPAVNVAVGLRLLARDERNDAGPLGTPGGLLLGAAASGLLLTTSFGSRNGWAAGQTLSAAVVAVAAIAALVIYQRRATTPFIPSALLTNQRYVILAVLGLLGTFANLAAQIGLPLLFNASHGLTTFEIGLWLVPAAIVTAVAGVAAGRLVDKVGAKVPMRSGATLMIIGAALFSVWAGRSVSAMAVVAMVLAAGYALVNTPLAATVSLLVEPQHLTSAPSLNTMMFFLGGSFGATAFSAIVTLSSGARAINPLHSGDAVGFSNGFAMLILPVVMGFILGVVLPRNAPPTAVAPTWTPDGQVPYAPRAVPQSS